MGDDSGFSLFPCQLHIYPLCVGYLDHLFRYELIALDFQDIHPRDIKPRLTLSSATSSCERERTLVTLLLKDGRCCSDRGYEMAVVAFTSLCSTYSLCSLSPIVSIFLIVLTTGSSSIPLECNACRSVLSSSNGFLISSSDVTRALTCSMS